MDELIKRLINYCEEMAGASLGADDIFNTYAPQFHDAIRDAVAAEHTRITEMAEAIEQGTYTTTKTVSQVLRAERP